ncbi:hypothetical protein ACFOVU_24070 [Nocardiopsis sediminis]|uniref:Uncharacterized protein n=1 Tax=Nocardiopsis sediminis TaxID=1778267 RepID=A0ABV8FUC0_9ACTN
MDEQHHAPDLRTRGGAAGPAALRRALIRVFVPPGALESGIARYERREGARARERSAFPAARLRSAVVGRYLLIEGDEEALRPFRDTAEARLLDGMRPYFDRIAAEGAEVIIPQRHPDGTVAGYLCHRPPGDGR